MTISIKNNSRNNQKTLTKFKTLVNNEGILEAYKAKRYYVNIQKSMYFSRPIILLIQEYRNLQNFLYTILIIN